MAQIRTLPLNRDPSLLEFTHSVFFAMTQDYRGNERAKLLAEIREELSHFEPYWVREHFFKTSRADLLMYVKLKYHDPG